VLRAVEAAAHVTTQDPSGRPQVVGASVLPNVRASNLGDAPVTDTPLAVDPLDGQRLLAGGEDGNCPNLLGFYASLDVGTTWPVQHCMPALPGTVGFGDPAVAFGPDGAMYVFGVEAATSLVDGVIAFQKSTDGGTTWSPVAPAVTALFDGGFTDKPWAEAAEAGPFAGCVFVSVTQFDGSFTNTVITVSRSCDGGATWSAPNPVHAVRLVPDTCFCAFYGNVPGTQEPASETPAIGADPATGALFVVDYSDTAGFMQTRVARSVDGGESWGRPVVVNPGSERDQFMPWLSVGDGGAIGVSYLLRSGSTYRETAAVSVDGGGSFRGNRPIATTSSAFVGPIGAYTGGAWSGGILRATWPDTRTGTSQAESGGVAR